MRFGFHVGIGGGFAAAAERAKALRCETMQVFSANPRGWAAKEIDPADAETFRKKCKLYNIHPVVVHMPYLPNLATHKKDIFKKSVEVLKRELRRAEILGASFLVTHLGKRQELALQDALKQVAEAVSEALSDVKNSVMVLLENTAGQGSEVGNTLEELAQILEHLQGHRRVGFCWDTAHGFEAGYDFRTKQKLDELVRLLDEYLGFERIKVLHLNDSRTPCCSRVDRHWHIGQGEIGEEAFKLLFAHPAFANLPAIMETPKKNPDDDVRNMETCLRLSGRR